MTRRFLAVLTVTGALAAGAPGLAAADPGNEATESLGTVQVGDTDVAPTATAAVTDSVAAAAAAPTAVAGSGGNTADQSAGTVQVGGDNSAGQAAGTAQVSGTSSEPQAGAEAAGAQVAAAAPVSTSGGANRADRSVGTVQVGGGNRASGSAVTVQIGPTTAGASVSAAHSGRPLAQVNAVVGGGSGGKSSDEMLGAVQAAPVTGDVSQLANAAGVAHAVGLRSIVLMPETATIQIESLSLDLEVATLFDSLVLLLAGVSIEVTPNGGNSTDGSPATGQVGGLAIRPDVRLTVEPLSTTVTLGGSGGVAGGGTNDVSDSLGTVQAGGGNAAHDSIGTIQIGAVELAPAASIASPVGILVLGGSSGIGGEGANTASDSIGTVQIGGGNDADSSVGSLQSGPVEVAPTLTLTETPTRTTVAVGGASGIGGNGGNSASDSAGTAQVGGGNDANGSAGTLQGGAVTLDPSLIVGGTPGGSVEGGTTIGDGAGGNSATDSIGTIQIGGGNSATDSGGTVQIGGGTTSATGPAQTVLGSGPAAAPATSAESSPATGLAPPAAAPPAPLPSVVTEQVAAENVTRPGRESRRPRTGTKLQLSPPTLIRPLGAATRLTATQTAATLPFTGVNLLLVALLGAALLGMGLGVRRVVPGT